MSLKSTQRENEEKAAAAAAAAASSSSTSVSPSNSSSSDGEHDTSFTTIEHEVNGSGNDNSNKVPLVSGFYAAEDINIPGLRRSKKKPAISRGGGPAYSMEDAHSTDYPLFDDQHKGLFCVFDGFAGSEASQDASKIVPKVASKVLSHTDDITKNGNVTDMTENLKSIFRLSDKELEVHEFVGTTATTLLIWRNTQNVSEDERYLQVANVGDSTAFLCRDGTAIPLSIDHKASSPKEHKRLRDSGIEVPDNMTRISGVAVARCLGNSFLKSENVGIIGTPDISQPYRVGPGDRFVILASDGLWDVISGQEACNMVRRMNNAEKMAKKLLKSATKKTKCIDNITVIVVLL